ncbi:MAG: protein O-mannosyl-transferase family [Terrimicrobiaceae bacterium]
MNERLWSRGDWLAGSLTGLVAFFVYLWTLAPNVTLLDSGEFIVAAQHFGVPHPTGYPLWTFLAWLFQLLPLGNAAWEINLFSAVCGGLATGVATLLSRSSLRWLLGDELAATRGLATIASVSCGLLFAFSFSMWSQAVIAEVYTLHALIVGLFLVAIYAWLRSPQSLWLLMSSFFLLAIAFGNHHLTVVMAPIPFFAVLLVRRDIFWDLVIAAFLTALLVYLGFAILSTDPVILKTAIRFFYCVMLGFVILVIVRRFDIEWRLVAYLPFVVVIGLLSYAYMPLASSTNPPMNWAYTKTPEGFFFSFNRSQYGGSLTQQSLRSLGRIVGTSSAAAKPAPDDPRAPEKSMFQTLQDWTGFFWLQLGRSFTPLGVLGYFLALVVIFRLVDVHRRTWVYILQIAFVLAAILQPAADGAQIDAGGWWLQMPYHTYTNLIFSLLAALGITIGALWIFRRAPRLMWLQYTLLAMPLLPLFVNYDGSSQRNRWFGWQFGHDMLKDLPPDSIVFGGTDPGRFVPTYMILGESGQDPSVKRDPNFDRRDLFIITQNGVGEPLYRKYLADHYGKDRPQPSNAFERWLGRADAYPRKTLIFPTDEEIQAATEAELEADSEGVKLDPAFVHSLVTRLIWEKNRDAHEFFVEESFPMKWSYDHAIPHGLVYRIVKDPLKAIPPDAVKKDMEFWRDYTERLLANPDFAKDFDAQRSFSKLRSTTGGLYHHRKMEKESEIAYRQALLLWPGNPDSLNALSTLFWDRGDDDAVIEMVSAANVADPNNIQLWGLRLVAEKRKEASAEIRDIETALAKDPNNSASTEKLLGLYSSLAQTNKVSEVLARAMPALKTNSDFLKVAASYAELNNLPDALLSAARELTNVEPTKSDAQLLLARAAIKKDDKALFLKAAGAAIQSGGLPAREALLKSPEFERWRDDPETKKLLGIDQ